MLSIRPTVAQGIRRMADQPPTNDHDQARVMYVRAILTALARLHFMILLLVVAVALLVFAFVLHVVVMAGR